MSKRHENKSSLMYGICVKVLEPTPRFKTKTTKLPTCWRNASVMNTANLSNTTTDNQERKSDVTPDHRNYSSDDTVTRESIFTCHHHYYYFSGFLISKRINNQTNYNCFIYHLPPLTLEQAAVDVDVNSDIFTAYSYSYKIRRDPLDLILPSTLD